MTDALIYKPSKTATQSGLKNTKKWILVYTPQQAQQPDTLIGWVGGGKTINQIRLTFDTRQQAIDYAQGQGLYFRIRFPKDRYLKKKAYADNFI